MNKYLSKSDFIEQCFRKRLEDGEPHSHRDILDYIREQAVGTSFEGTIEQNNAVLSFKRCIELPDSPYGRVRHGVYQKITSSVLRERQLSKQLGELHNLMDRALSIQKEMAELHTKCCEDWPEVGENFDLIWKSADQNLDTTIDCMTAWIAEMEDLDLEPQEETESPSMVMQL